MSSTIDTLENLSNNLEKRKPVYVTEDGKIHDAEGAEKMKKENRDKPLTQIKPTIWYHS